MEFFVSTAFVILCALSQLITVNGEFVKCQTPNGSAGSCKLIDACESIYKLAIRDYFTEDEMHFLQQSKCGVANNKPIVCCPEDGEEHDQEEVEKSSASNSCQTSNAEEGDCVRMEECQYWHEYLTAKKEADILFLKRNRCGSDVNSQNICCPKQKADKVIGELKVRAVVNDVASFEPSVKKGECMPIRNCSILWNLVQNPDKTDADIVFLQSNQCGYVNKSPLVYCPVERPPTPTETSTTRTTTTTTTLSPTTTTKSEVISGERCRTPNGTLGECKALENCDSLWNLHQMEHLTQEQLKFLEESECGTSDMDKVCCPKDIPKLEEAPQIATPVASFEPCVTSYVKKGECIPIRNCSILLNLVLKPDKTDADIVFLQSNQCGYVNNSPLVCCPTFEKLPMPTETSTTRTTQQQQQPWLQSQPQQPYPQPPPPKVKENYRDTTESTRIPSKQNKCGRADLTLRIVNGKETEIYEFPWTALLVYTNDNDEVDFFCGGALISKNYVLTAAHCADPHLIVEDFSLTSVRLGEWNTRTERDCLYDNRGRVLCAPPHRDVEVQRITIHPHYNSVNLTNDIALLRLAEYVDLTDFINVICLPLEASQQSELYVGAAAEVAGWGATETSPHSSVKLKTTITVLNSTQCDVKKARRGISISDKQICATGNRADSCYGDSGGPLMLTELQNGKISYYLIGLVSYGTGECGQKDTRGIYTRVGAYMDWIEDTMTK